MHALHCPLDLLICLSMLSPSNMRKFRGGSAIRRGYTYRHDNQSDLVINQWDNMFYLKSKVDKLGRISTNLVSHTVGNQCPYDHTRGFASHNAKAQPWAIIDQLNLLNMAPLVLQREGGDGQIFWHRFWKHSKMGNQKTLRHGIAYYCVVFSHLYVVYAVSPVYVL